MQIMRKICRKIRTLKIKQIETSEILSYSNFLRIMREWVRPRTATEIDGTLHTDFRKSETSRDSKKII